MNIDISEEAGVRYLHFGSSWIQGAMRVARPWALELEYTREMMAALLLRPDAWPRTVLLIGLGAASLTKFLYRHRPDASLTVVEIDHRVIAAARQFFKLPEDAARINMIIGDGVDFMARRGPSYDLILVDGFDAEARPGELESVPFYLNCRARLRRGGLFVANFLSRRKDHTASARRLRLAFDDNALVLPSCDSGNAIGIAGEDELTEIRADDLKQRMRSLKRDTGLNLAPLLARLEAAAARRQTRDLVF